MTTTAAFAPACTITSYEDGWEISVHLQVGLRTFRNFTKILPSLDDVTQFLTRWNANWHDEAIDTFAYEGIEDTTEVDHGPVHPDLASIAEALLPKREPIKRRF